MPVPEREPVHVRLACFQADRPGRPCAHVARVDPEPVERSRGPAESLVSRVSDRSRKPLPLVDLGPVHLFVPVDRSLPVAELQVIRHARLRLRHHSAQKQQSQPPLRRFLRSSWLSPLLLHQLRGTVRSVDRHVTARAVRVSRLCQVVERGRLRSQRVRRDRRVALDAHLRHVRTLQEPRVHRPVRLVARHALPLRHPSVR